MTLSPIVNLERRASSAHFLLVHSGPANNSRAEDLIYPLSSILARIEPHALFPRVQPLEVELGSGDGSFLVEYAQAHAERNFVGVERLLGRLRKIAKKASRAGLTNVRAIRIESAYFLRYLLPQQSVAALHVYFPDPWPKRKHRRHRLINETFAGVAYQVLAPGGRIYLRTDDADYFDQMLSVFKTENRFIEIETPEELTAVRTDFEIDFNARGIPTLRQAYQRA